MKKRMPKDRTLTDMRRFFHSLNWKELWTEWFTELSPSGSLKYRTVGQFARAKTRNTAQKEFLQWYIGPKKDLDELKAKYPFIIDGPQDWVEKRETGGWIPEDEYKKIVKKYGEIGQNALQAMQKVGDTLILNCMLRWDWLGKKVDEGFRGGLFLPNLSFAENVARVKLLFGLASKVNQEQIHLFKEGYAKAYGVNFDDLDGVQALMTASAMVSQQAGKHVQSGVEKFVQMMSEMALYKSATYGNPLPPEVEQKAIDIGGEEIKTESNKKKVQ